MDLCSICKVEECYCGWKEHVENLWPTEWDMDNEEERWRRSWQRWISSQQLLNAKIANMTPEEGEDEAEEEAEPENYVDYEIEGKVFLVETNSLVVFEKTALGEPGAKVGFKAQSAPPPAAPAPPPTALTAPEQPQ